MMAGRTVILMYHAVENPGSPSGYTEKGELIYVVSESDFREQIAMVADSGIDVGLPGEQAEGSSLILTFDDGHLSNHSIVLPILRDTGIKAAFFVTSGFIGTENHMTEEMIRELDDAGMIVGSHAKTHRFLTDLSDEEAGLELSASKEVLERIVGHTVDCFSAPGGRIDGRIERLAREAGYRWIFTSEAMVNTDLSPAVSAGRFAIMRNSSPEWYSMVLTGSVPLGGRIKYGILGVLKKVLGTRLYLKLRERMLGRE